MNIGGNPAGAQSDDIIRTSEPLTICFAVRALPEHRLGGLEHHVRDLALELEQRGHEIHIVTTPGGRAGFFPCCNYITGDGRADDDDVDFEDKYSEESPGVPFTLGASAENHDGLKIMIHELSGVRGGDYSVGFFRKLGSVLKAVCDIHQVDVLCPIDMAGLFLDKRDFQAVVIPLIHGTMTSEVPLDWRYWKHLTAGEKLRALWTYKSRIVLWPFFRRMVNRADGIIVDSEFTRRELLTSVQGRGRSIRQEVADSTRLGGLAQRIHVAQLGISSWWYPLLAGPRYKGFERPLKIALLGRLQKIKGLEMAIRAAAGLRVRGVDFLMTIGGKGTYEAEGKALVQELGLENQVRFVGRVSPVVQMSRFLESQDVFLFPDLTQPAFGLVALEAMQYELPVVAARVGAVPEVVTEETGWLYDPWDVDDLVRVLAEAAGNREFLHEKGWRAHELVMDHFSAEKMAERTEGAMRATLERKL